jgi:tRNA threonylcarbamoyladenosine biosynthesis protein TsaB
MLILALDTTTGGGSRALWRDGVLDERAGDASRTHAERLPADLASLVASHGLTLADVDLYAVASGPGSFTGMRVGIATIQGLALVHGRLVVAVSALEALAHTMAARTDHTIVGAWMEAYRGEVFAALYRVDAQDRARVETWVSPTVGRPLDVAMAWAQVIAPEVASSLVVVGDGVATTGEVLRHVFGPKVSLLEAPLLAGTLASLAAVRRHDAVRPHAIVPVYVRRPDAVLGRERRAAEAPEGSDVASTR